MDIAGPEDERPGDEVEGIRYFDFSDPAAPSPRAPGVDPFAREGLPDAHEAPPPVQATRREADRAFPRAGEDLEPIDPFEFALVGVPLDRPISRPKQDTWEQDLLHPEPEEPEEHVPPVRFFELASLFDPPDTDDASRERFAAAFTAARARRDEPFLAIALRMAPYTPAAAHFPIVADGIRSLLHPGDVLLADERRLRLVAVLHGRRAAETQAVFAHLADHLRMWIDDADVVLSAISALAAPDGRPFERADTFLARAFDRD